MSKGKRKKLIDRLVEDKQPIRVIKKAPKKHKSYKPEKEEKTRLI